MQNDNLEYQMIIEFVCKIGLVAYSPGHPATGKLPGSALGT